MLPMYFLNIYKEKGITSFDIIHKLRKILGIRKIGHSGTLDPLAQGVMQVAVGNASRLLEYLDDDKEYIAEIKFGYNSTTQDEEGEKTFVAEPNFSEQKLKESLKKFEGEISQVPPIYSAIKIDGKKLCDLARKNHEIPEVKPRDITIYKIDLLEFRQPDFAKIKVHCSKGTYIRALVRDIGQSLSCGGYLTDLTRTKAGNFYMENSIKISENVEQYKLDPVNVLNLNKIVIDEQQYKKVMNGNPLKYSTQNQNEKKYMLIFNNRLVSIANLSDNILKMEKVFKTE